MNGLWRVLDGPAGALRCYSNTAAETATRPVLIICHELPRHRGASEELGQTLPALADRLVEEAGIRVVAPALRGAGGSRGDFSATGWLDDLSFLLEVEVGATGRAWLAGYELGGVLALRHAVDDGRVRGIACLGVPTDMASWVGEPAAFLERCRASGCISKRAFPEDLLEWSAEILALDPMAAAGELADRPLLVVHGTEDAEVPLKEAALLAESVPSDEAEFRLVLGAGHWLRADPRAAATLIGWMERHR